MKELIEIQSKLKAPKGQFNSFGKYAYRSCEDVLEALKPLLKEHNSVLTLSDDMVNIGERYYIKATATIISDSGTVSVSAFAREDSEKKGMDASQLSGATSSYARKYALNGLFLIDDNKDSDTTNLGEKLTKKVIDAIAGVGTQQELADLWNSNKALQSNNEFIKLVKEKKELL